MKIEINLKILFVILLFLLIENFNTYLIFLIFILIHELSHLFVGVILGGIPKKMTISAFGVSLEFYSYLKSKTFNKIIFYSIGPLVNLFIAFFIKYFFELNDVLKKIIIVNMSIGIFNLIPILPLDGGKILKEFLKNFLKVQTANIISIYISKIILISITVIYSVLILKVKNIIILFLIIYLWYLYKIEEKKLYIYLKVYKSIENMI